MTDLGIFFICVAAVFVMGIAHDIIVVIFSDRNK